MSTLRRRLHGLPLRRRLALVLVVVGGVAVAGSIVAVLAFVVLSERTSALADRYTPARLGSEELRGAYLDQETGVRGYALSGDSKALVPYHRGRAQEAATVRQLHGLLRGEPDLLAMLDRTQRAARRWRVEVADPTMNQVKAGRSHLVVDAARGRARFDRVRSSSGALDDALAAARLAARKRVKSATEVLEALLVLVGLGLLLSAVLLWMTLRRWVVVPMGTLGDEIDQVASGDVGHRVNVVGPPEVVRLADQVDAMRVRVVEEYAEALSARHAAEQAQEMLEEQAAELRRSNTELEQFAYVASHDLQEPLRKVASFCQMLERRYAGQLDERADQYITFAVDGAKRMQQLINDLLAFSRVGRMTTARNRVELDDALAEAMRALETAREETGAVVKSDPLPAVNGDSTLLAQLFQNLIANGIKFSGGKTPQVHIAAERAGDFWQLSCTDNGIGIEPRYAERIFVIFQRLHAKDEYEGTGIGLSLCRKIVEYHGGRIWLDEARAESGLRGARIVWTLPVISADAAGSDAPVEGTIGRGAGDEEAREHADA